MKPDHVELFKDLVIFSLDQFASVLKIKLEDYRNNSSFKDSKPIVHKENITVMEEEVVYVGSAKKFLEEMDTGSYKDVKLFKDELLEKIYEHNRSHAAPGVIDVILKEKLENCWSFYQKMSGK